MCATRASKGLVFSVLTLMSVSKYLLVVHQIQYARIRLAPSVALAATGSQELIHISRILMSAQPVRTTAIHTRFAKTLMGPLFALAKKDFPAME